eukprot:1161512-Pelagomonas_calceolata.AAC.12
MGKEGTSWAGAKEGENKSMKAEGILLASTKKKETHWCAAAAWLLAETWHCLAVVLLGKSAEALLLLLLSSKSSIPAKNASLGAPNCFAIYTSERVTQNQPSVRCWISCLSCTGERPQSYVTDVYVIMWTCQTLDRPCPAQTSASSKSQMPLSGVLAPAAYVWLQPSSLTQLARSLFCYAVLICRRLEAPLLQALSEKFVPYSYPPNSLMVAQGAACKEVFILLSGQV